MPKVVTTIWVRSSWPKSIAPRITNIPRTDAYGSRWRRHRRRRLGDAGAMGTVDITGSCDHAAKAWGAHSYDMESSPLLIGACVPLLERQAGGRDNARRGVSVWDDTHETL